MQRIAIWLYCMMLVVSAHAGSTQALAAVQLEPVFSGLTNPLYVTNAHDGSRRLFMVEQPGRIRVLQPGATSAGVFLDITGRVLSTGGEQGLLGLAFHPRFPTDRRFFVNYTRQTDGATVIAQYQVSASNPNLADTAETVILVVPQPFANHNGGMIEFGPDGYLYIGMGDGGSANDPGNRAQNVNELLGKVLRIDINTPNGAVPYSSPSDNPFAGAIAGRDEIYALGFRNPWRWSFNRSTGQLYLADVGQSAIEEIDIVTRGGNYGWRVYEGTHCTGLDPDRCAESGFINPIYEYSHAAGRCSITGGYVYRGAGQTLPGGAYVFGDYCSGEIFLLQGSIPSLLLDTNHNITSFGEDEAGEIYVVARSGAVFRLRDPDRTQFSVNDVSVTEGNTGTVNAVFTVRLSGPSTQPATITYYTQNIAATAGSDYTRVTGRLTFAAGETTKTISVPVLGDTLDEANEVFKVILASPVNAVVVDSEGIGTIVDDDPLPSLSINNISVTEGNSGVVNATFTVLLSVASGRTVAMSYYTQNISAVGGSDYTHMVGRLNFAPGETTKTLSVAVNGDLLDEVNETFAVLLSSVSNATLGDGRGDGTIIDDDSPPALSVNDVTVTESAAGTRKIARYTVRLSSPSGQSVSVSYFTQPGTATQETDYLRTTGALNFTPGITTRTIDVPIIGDALVEADETFQVVLASAVRATIADGEGTGTILNDDSPAPTG